MMRREWIERSVIMLAALSGCGGSSATDAGADAAQRVDRPMASSGPPEYRACVTGGRDPEGGFCDATAMWGMAVTVDLHSMMSLVRGGLTAADFDGDGRVDVLVTPATDVAPTLLMRRGDGWVDVAAEWGLGGLRRTLPSAAADLDGDGDQDLVIGFTTGSAVRLFRNEGARFVEATPPLGREEELSALLPVDLDRDGRLDLIVAALSYPGACSGDVVNGCPAGVRAYRQVDAWRFEPIAVDAPGCRAQALAMVDWDGDGRDEVLVATDYGMFFGGNMVLRPGAAPGGALTLRNVTAGTGFDQEMFAMGIGAIDVDGDGQDEFLLTNLGRNALITRRGGRGVDVARMLGADNYGMSVPGATPRLRYFDPDNAREGPYGRFQEAYLDPSASAFPTTKWTPVVFDLDDDGVSDVYIPAGTIFFDIYPEPSQQHGALLRGTGRDLVDVTGAMGVGARHDTHSAAAADLDADGDLDLVVFRSAMAGVTGGLTVLRNDASTGRSLVVVARGRGAARDGIGAMVQVTVGGRRMHRRLDGNLSIFGSGPHEAHFGLGAAAEAGEVTVRFPSGAVVRRERVPAGRVVIEE